MNENTSEYKVVPFPRMRRLQIDAGRLGRRRHTLHILSEVDVTKPRQYIRDHKMRTGETLSFTAFIATCLAKAVDVDKHMHAYRTWRNQLVIFDDVDVQTMIEIETGDRKIPMPHILKAANKRAFREIHEEIRAIQAAPNSSGGSRFMQWFPLLPTMIRDFFYWFVSKNPQLGRKFGGTVVLTAVGMFGKGAFWGLGPGSLHTLGIILGGIAEKPGIVDGRIEIREYLSMTISFDHDVIDGAPAARFFQRLKELVENGYGIRPI